MKNTQTQYIYLFLGCGIFAIIMLVLGTTGPTGISTNTREAVLNALPYLAGLGIVVVGIPALRGRK